MTIVGFDHVQIAIPPGGESAARAFYGELLGLSEIPKPPALAARGGLWYTLGAAELHLGIEADFRAAKKAHPALKIKDLAALVARLEAAGVAIGRDVPLAGMDRAQVNDPFGNKVELVERFE